MAVTVFVIASVLVFVLWLCMAASRKPTPQNPDKLIDEEDVFDYWQIPMVRHDDWG